MSSSARFVLSVAVVVVSDGRVLCLRRSRDRPAFPGVWETISGRVEPGEQPEAAALRELREEAGLSGERLSRGVVGPSDAYVMERLGEPMCVLVYRADVVTDAIERSSEHDLHAWCSLAEVREKMPARLADAVAKVLG